MRNIRVGAGPLIALFRANDTYHRQIDERDFSIYRTKNGRAFRNLFGVINR